MTQPINTKTVDVRGTKALNLLVTREADTTLRLWIEEDGAAANLTGDTIVLVAKTARGGVEKLNEEATLEDQTGALRGQATVLLPRAKMIGTGTPNDDLAENITWLYQVRRTHAGLISVPFAGELILAPGL